MKTKTLLVAIMLVLALIGAGGMLASAPAGVGGLAKLLNNASDAPAPAEPDKPRPVTLASVECASGGQTRIYPGLLRASSQADLAFRVGGPLVAVNFKPGEFVRKGDVLMQIDQRDFEDSILVLEAQLAGAKASLDQARLNFDRVRPLREQKVVSQADYDNAKSAHDAAKAAVQGIEAQLRIARHKLADTTLAAPFDGVVVEKRVENHEMVAQGQVVLTMDDISVLEVEVNIPENEMPFHDIRPGVPGRVSFPSRPGREYEARLVEWNAQADAATRTYKVSFAMDAPADFRALPGMTAELKLESKREECSMLTIPASAVVADQDGGSAVWVYDEAGATAVKRPVKVGRMLPDSRLEVLDGLDDGERVVAAGVDFITPGMKIRPLVKE